MKKGNENKPYIGLFGRRNYGKSSLINFITLEEISIVSPEAGTTTDPVKKSMELGGIGPVVWVDTAGIDDEGKLGTLRVEKTLEALSWVDLALIVFSNNEWGSFERLLLGKCRELDIPFAVIYSQSDRIPLLPSLKKEVENETGCKILEVSIQKEECRENLRTLLCNSIPESAYKKESLLGDVIHEQDTVVMVCPIDSSAPEGRMILPQVQVLRDILDNNAKALVVKESELESALNNLKEPPELVITDSQAFALVSKIVPEEIPLTSFSVVLARNKGLFKEYLEGTPKISELKDGDKVLLLESCTHNVTCEDIGRVKIPNLLKKYTGKQLYCDVVAGLSPVDLKRPLEEYSLVIQCGGCVVTERQLRSRLLPAVMKGIPVSNYGLSIALMTGIFHRAVKPFEIQSINPVFDNN